VANADVTDAPPIDRRCLLTKVLRTSDSTVTLVASTPRMVERLGCGTTRSCLGEARNMD